ncbi:sugar phosphate isomerase/epimerase family protein [Elusimicrobiota bacterium]
MNNWFSMSNFILKKDIPDIIQWGIENGFNGVELWADAPFLFVDNTNRDILSTIAENSNEIKFSVHSPLYGINISSVNPGIRKESVRQIKKIFEWKKYLHLEHVVIHPGYSPSSDKNIIEKVYENFAETIIDIINTAEKSGVIILLENIGIDNKYIDREYDFFLKISDRFNLDICLDTGHLNVAWKTPLILEGIKQRIKAYHISDNFGIADEHLPVGEGNISWEMYAKNIFNETVPMIHEINRKGNSGASTLKSRRNLEKIMKDVSRETSG